MDLENKTQKQGIKSKGIILSALLLIVLSIGFGIYSHNKKADIVYEDAPEQSGTSQNGAEPAQDVLAQFNNTPLAMSQGNINNGSSKTISFLFLGNSITRHSITDFWDHECGMAATVEENDYVHQVVSRVAKEKKVNVKYAICNIADFERGFPDTNFDWNSILSQSDIKTPDYVIVQIGENMRGEDVELFEDELRAKYTGLLNNFPKSKRIVTLPFWYSPKKNYIFTDIALATHSYIADISHLGCDSGENYASSEISYDYPGIGEHPGDRGMKRIGEMIYSIINND